MKKQNHLSLIIPAYNEEKVIRQTLEKVLGFLSKKPYSWEVLVVDDGSVDRTSAIVEKFKNKNVRLINLTPNQGKGAALRAGFLSAKGKFIIYSDADLSVPLKNINVFLRELGKSDVVIGSRRVRGANILVHQNWMRENMGRFYTFLSRFVTRVDVSDFTCGFKGFTHKSSQKIFKKAIIDRWAYDSEILFLAKKFGYQIAEMPVEWKNREDTRVRLGKAVITSFADLLKIRINDISGRYNN